MERLHISTFQSFHSPKLFFLYLKIMLLDTNKSQKIFLGISASMLLREDCSYPCFLKTNFHSNYYIKRISVYFETGFKF